jgi:HPt (histidine-containing phosphotransfer) domain-containing protein
MDEKNLGMKAEIRQYIVSSLELDDEETILMLLDSYAESLNENTTLLQKSLQAGRLDAAAELAHALKGASANIGARPFYELCSGLEQALKGGDAASGKKILTDLLLLREEFLREASKSDL